MPVRLQNSDPGKVEIPVTAMLDMTFQQLAFLVLTFQPLSSIEGAVRFSLPARPAAVFSFLDPTEAIAPMVELPGQLAVLVKAAHNGIDDGTISALILCSDEGETLLASIDGLRQTLRNRRQVQPGFRLRIAAESRLRYSLIMEVLDAYIEVGFANVGLVPPPDLTR